MRAGWLIGALLFPLGGAMAVWAVPAGNAVSCWGGGGGPQQAAPRETTLVAGTDLVERGRKLVEQAECGRCHTLPSTVAALPRQRTCAGCHAWIRATREDPAAAARERQHYPLWDRYMATVSSF